MNMKNSKKSTIQQYWTENVPGLDMVNKDYKPDQKEFYQDADNFRYKFEPYVIDLIKSFASKGKLILEVGCGMGTDSRLISRLDADIVSLDLSMRNVSFSLKGMSLLGLKGKGVNSDAENLPFRDGTFDIVYSYGVLHHTPDTQKAINEVYRVLKPNGKAVIMLYHKGYAYYALLLMHGYKKILGIYNKDRLTSQYDHTPLSRMYSKQEIKRIFCNYRNLKLSVVTYGGIQAHALLKYLYKAFQRWNFLMRNFGSFLIIEAEK